MKDFFHKDFTWRKFNIGIFYNKPDDYCYFRLGPNLWACSSFWGFSFTLMNLSIDFAFCEVKVWKSFVKLFKRKTFRKRVTSQDGKSVTREFQFELGNWTISHYRTYRFYRGFKYFWVRVGPFSYSVNNQIDNRSPFIEADKFDFFIESWNEPSSSD